MDIKELINRRRRQIVLHSYLYYQLNTNIISDHTYDAWCKELAELQQKHPEESGAVEYLCKEFKDFDGSTGFHLGDADHSSHDKAMRLLRYHEKRRGS
ncbi:NAD-dependent DNA ligase [Bacillus phage vB_BpsS-36]|uniref:NAD-dependent DNA ligase n=1 Tax=Bacillus phage vB_BpsS-36 TaxID=2419622 RepID=A0A3G3BXA0_9CAUD|nr:NAD-dependent DNA ligase [Bacillus phage vB_BpsS-36]